MCTLYEKDDIKIKKFNAPLGNNETNLKGHSIGEITWSLQQDNVFAVTGPVGCSRLRGLNNPMITSNASHLTRSWFDIVTSYKIHFKNN